MSNDNSIHSDVEIIEENKAPAEPGSEKKLLPTIFSRQVFYLKKYCTPRVYPIRKKIVPYVYPIWNLLYPIRYLNSWQPWTVHCMDRHNEQELDDQQPDF